MYPQTGASKLIHAIWAGEITELSDELVQPIGQWLKKYAKAAAIADSKEAKAEVLRLVAEVRSPNHAA